MASRKWPGANRGLLLVAFLLLGTIPLFPQVAIEVDAGLNLFDIVPNAFTLDVSVPTFGSGQLVQGITTPNMFAFGVTAGAYISDFFIGGELAFFSGALSGANLSFSGALFGGSGTLSGTSSVDPATYIRVGPVIRYYFLKTVRPFVGLALDYVSATVTPPSDSVFTKATLGLLEIAPMVGVSYEISQFSIGAYARFGYFFTIAPHVYSSLIFTGDTVTASEDWGPLSLMVLAAYKFGGRTSAPAGGGSLR